MSISESCSRTSAGSTTLHRPSYPNMCVNATDLVGWISAKFFQVLIRENSHIKIPTSQDERPIFPLRCCQRSTTHIKGEMTLTLPLAMSALALKMNLARRSSVGSSQDEYPWYTALVTIGDLWKRGSSAHAMQRISNTVCTAGRPDNFTTISSLSWP
jgi:hypothetical protein